MLGLMQDVPLTTTAILDRAVQLWGNRTIVTSTVVGPTTTEVRTFGKHTRRLAAALDALDLTPDARIGTFCSNTEHHLQLYFAVPATGRVLHTINIRYSPEQIRYCIGHASDEAVFVDRGLCQTLLPILQQMEAVRYVVIVPDGTDHIIPPDRRIIHWADLVENTTELDWEGRISNEDQAAGLCYTTGTTGNPKGVLYSHRSIWLHANAHLLASTSAITDRDTVMPVVPMFHAMAWGLPYAAVLAGANLVMPGADLSPAALLGLIDTRHVTYSAGVPTVWMAMLPLLPSADLSSLNRIMMGGSAVPPSLLAQWHEATGSIPIQAWGMTESSPVGAMTTLRRELAGAEVSARLAAHGTAGIPLVGVQARILEPGTATQAPWDDTTTGELQIRGPWVARQYYGTTSPGEQFTDDGWLRTGDVAAISPLGYIKLVDRTKDLIKSGGEWISSIDLENLLMTHPAVTEAAVIAVPDPKWIERPLACVVRRDGVSLSRSDVIEFLIDRLPRWQVPDDVVFVDEIPKTSVGKFSKKDLRDQYATGTLTATDTPEQ